MLDDIPQNSLKEAPIKIDRAESNIDEIRYQSYNNTALKMSGGGDLNSGNFPMASLKSESKLDRNTNNSEKRPSFAKRNLAINIPTDDNPERITSFKEDQ